MAGDWQAADLCAGSLMVAEGLTCVCRNVDEEQVVAGDVLDTDVCAGLFIHAHTHTSTLEHAREQATTATTEALTR